jgi:hypothetical protein
MSKIRKWTGRAVLTLIVGFIGVNIARFTILPMGNGSMLYARTWKHRLDHCVTLTDVTNRFECLDVTDRNIGWSTTGNRLILHTFTNGHWMVLRCANSHGNPWGGTVVTRDSTGKTRVFFGHVCGSDKPRGHSLDEAYSNLVTSMDREEVFLDEK